MLVGVDRLEGGGPAGDADEQRRHDRDRGPVPARLATARQRASSATPAVTARTGTRGARYRKNFVSGIATTRP